MGSMTRRQEGVRLTVELVPKTSWGRNLRSVLPLQDWDRLRFRTYRRAGFRCEVCGREGCGMHSHEMWSYDDAARVQRLTGLLALCSACHKVKHLGHAQLVGRGPEALEHLAAINGWDADTVARYVAAAFRVWRARSQGPWRLDLSWLSSQGVAVPPGDAVLAGRVRS